MTTLSELPENLPVPRDDGACAHLVGMRLPAQSIPATIGESIDLSTLPAIRTVIFVFPMTGRPGVPLPDGWDAIPGARGCTPQNCSIRDAHRDLIDRGVDVLALSAQPAEEQAEMAQRLHLPYPVLCDDDFRIADAMSLPTFRAGGRRFIHRLTLIIRNGFVEHVIYPVFPPDRGIEPVLAWLDAHRLSSDCD